MGSLLKGSRVGLRTLWCATALSVVLGIVAVAPPSYAAAGTVSGVVYQDFDGDGTRDAGDTATGVQTDIGFGGVTVTAYGARGAVVGTATTAADGSYSINTSSVPDGTPLRIESPDANGGTAEQLPGDYQSSFAGPDNGTSVQFATAGDEGVDFGVLEPEDYAADNAPIMTAIQYAGLRSVPEAAAQPAVVANPWVVPANDPASGSYPGRVDLATYGEVGSVWGMAFARSQNAAYAAASYKRISELGPLGLGGIYRITDVLAAGSGALNDPATGAVTPWLDVTTLGVDVGTVPSSADRGLGSPDALVRDTDAFVNAGKVGIGGIAINEDGTTLYFVNLFDRDLYAVDITDGASPTTATRIPLGLTAGQRPWAVSVNRNRVYVGYVDTNGDGATPGVPATGNMHVVSQPEATAATGGAAWTNTLTAPLDFQKGNNITGWGGPLPPTTAIPDQVGRWNSWTDNWYWDGDNGSVGFNTSYGWTQNYPQPILGSITFDAQGYMTLGFVDRSSIQGGNRQWAPEPPPGCAAPCATDERYFETVSGGDILIATPDGTLEDDAVAGARTGANAGNNEGPGGGEFYNDRQDVGRGVSHWDNTLGGVIAYPGLQEVASTAMDPLDAIRVTGLSWFSVDDGQNLRGYNHTPDPLPRRAISFGSAPTAPFFQKGGGLGAVSLLTREPPVEIGNRVWLDADLNGRQDPDEPAIEGAPVTLFARGPDGAPAGAALASTTTNARGEYYFRSDQIAGFDPAATQGATLPYLVVFGRGTGPVTFTGPNATNPGFAGITWADLAFTSQATAAVQRDSNPNPDNGRAPVNVGSPGRNNHTIDAGFVARGTFQITKRTQGDPPRPGQRFRFDVTAATDFRGDNVLPSVNPATFTVAPGQTAPAVPQRLPVGTRITISERGGEALEATYEPARTQLITVNGRRSIVFTVTNQITNEEKNTPEIRTVTSRRRVVTGRPFFDILRVRGLADRGGTATARLYGPFSSRAAITCKPATRVRSKTFHVENGRNRTPAVRVRTPGVYTWRAFIRPDAVNRSATHKCGQVAETTVVAKPGYVAPIIDGGFSGTIKPQQYDRRAPTTITIPGLRKPAVVRSGGVRKGRMALPGNVHEVARLKKSAGFGDKIGATVVAGHVSDRHDRPGAMWRLNSARPGQRIKVMQGGERFTFVVTGKKTFDRRHRVPQRYFSTTGRHRLVLVSCTDRMVYRNGHFHYTRYVVVVARQVRK